MSAQLVILLPHAVLILGAMLCFFGGHVISKARLWGPFCLLVIAVSGAILLRASQAEFESTASEMPLVQQTGLGVLLQWGGLAFGLFYCFVAADASKSFDISPRAFGSLLLAVCGLMLACVARELWLLYAAVELTSLPVSLMLFAGYGNNLSKVGASKHLTMTLLSSAILLLGLMLIYGATGSTHLDGIRESLTAASSSSQKAVIPALVGNAGMVLVLAAMGYRLAIVPFQFGYADIIESTTPWNVGWLTTISQGVGVVVIVLVLMESLPGYERVGQSVCLALSALGMLAGGALALTQTNLRRMLAYLTIANVSLAMMAAAVGFWDRSAPDRTLLQWDGAPAGVEACLFFLGGTLFSTGGLVAILVYLSRAKQQVNYVDDLAGLVSREPIAAFCGTICLMNLAGAPPLPSFWGRLFAWGAALSVHLEPERQQLPVANPAFVLLALLSIVCVMMIAAACLRVVIVMFFEGQVARPEPAGGQPALAAAVLATMLTLGVGLLPGPILGVLQRTVRENRTATVTSPAAAGRFTPPADRTIQVAGNETDTPAQRERTANPQP